MKRICAGFYKGTYRGQVVRVHCIEPIEDRGYGLKPFWVAEVNGGPAHDKHDTKREAIAGIIESIDRGDYGRTSQ